MPPRRGQRVQRSPEESVNAGEDPVNPMQQFIDMLVNALQDRAPNPVGAPPPATHLANFKDFKVVGPPEFKGTTDPIEAQTWIAEIEKVFLVARVAEEQKTDFATFMLKGEANFWWMANKTRAEGGRVPWNRFKEMFFETYFPTTTQDRMEVQFLELKQGNMTVPDYAAKFNELARFAPHQVNTEERKCKRFEQGLKPWLYSKVSMFQIRTFSDMLEKAIIAEGGSEAVTKYNQEKKGKKVDGSNREGSSGGSNSNKRKWSNNNTNTNSGGKQGEPKKKFEACSNCGKNHLGVCMKGKNVCFKCGQEGHISPNCPNPKKIQGKGCFSCGSTDHLIKNCPKKGTEGGSGNKGNNSGKLMIGGPTQSGRPTARTFNMTVQDAWHRKMWCQVSFPSTILMLIYCLIRVLPALLYLKNLLNG